MAPYGCVLLSSSSSPAIVSDCRICRSIWPMKRASNWWASSATRFGSSLARGSVVSDRRPGGSANPLDGVGALMVLDDDHFGLQGARRPERLKDRDDVARRRAERVQG